MLTYVLSVPVEQCDEFVANGWEFANMDKERAGSALVCKYVSSNGPDENGKTLHIGAAKRPRLLQRAVIRRPFGRYRDSRFFDSVTLEHQSDSQFALGVPASLKRMYHTRFVYSVFKAENLVLHKDNRKYALRICTRLRGNELEQYVNWLIAVRSGELKMPFASGFTTQDFADGMLPTAPDLWWDLENDVIFSFDKNYMSRLTQHLDVSYSLIEDNYESGSIRRAD